MELDLKQAMQDFEKRNNISITVTYYSDGSCGVEELWDGELLNESETLFNLVDFLNKTKYKLSKDGRCISPVQVIKSRCQKLDVHKT